VINDYERAKSLYGNSDVPLFKDAMIELEKKMVEFKTTLKSRLVDMPTVNF
jgi:exocyst complex component 2